MEDLKKYRYCELSEIFVHNNFHPEFVDYLKKNGKVPDFINIKGKLRNPTAQPVKHVQIIGFELRRMFKKNCALVCLAYYKDTKEQIKHVTLSDDWYTKSLSEKEKEKLEQRKKQFGSVPTKQILQGLIQPSLRISKYLLQMFACKRFTTRVQKSKTT